MPPPTEPAQTDTKSVDVILQCGDRPAPARGIPHDAPICDSARIRVSQIMPSLIYESAQTFLSADSSLRLISGVRGR